VPDVQDFDDLFGGTVHNGVRRADKLAGSLHLTRSAKAGEGCKLLNSVENPLSGIPASGGIVLLDVFNRGLELVSRLGCPPNPSHE
jgi:hypothetical protein